MTTSENYVEYMRDESRSVGSAEYISFPRTEDEVVRALSYARGCQAQVTVQGARTGITGGAVPNGGHVINLTRMKSITGLRYDSGKDAFFLMVEPGVLLIELRKVLASNDFNTNEWSVASLQALELLRNQGPHVFTPDPTEASATIGGMVACNASGARSYFYGPTRAHIESLSVVLANGSLCKLQRGVHLVENGCFTLRCRGGEVIAGELPQYDMPNVKNASGYYVKPDMDLLDIFVGSEGTLGIVTEIELRLMPAPKAVCGVTVFFPEEESALRFVRTVRGEYGEQSPRPVAIEYFNSQALDLLRGADFGQVQALPASYHTAIYVEFHVAGDELAVDTVLNLGKLIGACGGDEAATWVATNAHDMERLLSFRHAIPESVNRLIDERRKLCAGLTKLGTDMAVPDHELLAVVNMYNQRLADSGLEAVMFGHIGDNHIHVNILPRDMGDYHRGKSLYLDWAREVVRLGGTVSAEHGIGKLKCAYLVEMYGVEGIEKMRSIKRIFDPSGKLGIGNMFAGGALK